MGLHKAHTAGIYYPKEHDKSLKGTHQVPDDSHSCDIQAAPLKLWYPEALNAYVKGNLSSEDI